MKYFKFQLCFVFFSLAFVQTVFTQCDPMPEIFGDTLLCPNGEGELFTQTFDSYQWYKRAYSDTVTEVISGATSQTITINSEDDGLYYFSVEATEDTCTVRSEEVLVDVYVFLLPVVRSSGDFEIDPSDGSSILCEGDTMYFTLLPPYDTSITWFKDGSPIPGENDTTLAVTMDGDYWVQGAPSVCPDFIQQLGVTLTVKVEDCTSNSEDPFSHEIEIYPNPVRERLHIKNMHDFSSLEIISLNGQVLEKAELQSGSMTINLSHYQSGFYLIKFEKKGRSFWKKVMVE